MRILLLCLALIGLTESPLRAQQTVQEYPFQRPPRDDTEFLSYRKSLVGVFNAEEDTERAIHHRYVDFGESRLYATLMFYPNDFDKEATLHLQLNTAHRKQQWRVGIGNVNAYDAYVYWENCTAFYWRETLFIKLFFRAFNDFADRGAVRFYTPGTDSVYTLGGIALFDRDDASGERTFELYDGELKPLVSSTDGIRVTVLRKELSDYHIEFLLTSEELKLIRDHKPEFHISRQKAEALLKEIFESYYSDEWKAKASEPGGRVRRAEAFLWRFDELRHLRRDFAPAHYNLACMLAVQRRPKEAIAALKTAFGLDGGYKQKALTDPDLSSLHEMLEFKALFK